MPKIIIKTSVAIFLLHLTCAFRNDSDVIHPLNPEVKSIVLPFERAKAIRGCSDCPNSRASSGKKACFTIRCKPLGTRCSQVPELGHKYVTASSHHCRRRPDGQRGASLFCCEKGSKEGELMQQIFNSYFA